MALTPNQLFEELSKTGRRVSKRRLTDWRQRGLLPGLIRKSRGRGKGAIYVWEQSDVLDQAAFVADLPSWDTPQIIFALWCCGFKVPRESLREAWLDAVQRLSRSWAKQDMKATPSSEGEGYFDQLGDEFHKLAKIAEQHSIAQGEAFATHVYGLAQIALAIIFANRMPVDIGDDIQYVNGLLVEYSLNLWQPETRNIKIIDLNLVARLRKHVNIFEIQKAVREASSVQLDALQFAWNTVGRIIEFFLASKLDRELGLTIVRRMQGTFGPVFLSCLVVALRTRDPRLLIRLSQHFAGKLDNFELEKSKGHWQGADGLLRYFKETGWSADPVETGLWNEFWA